MVIGITTALVGGSLALMIPSLYPPLADWYSQVTYKSFPSKIANIQDLVVMYRKGIIDKAIFEDKSMENGFPVELAGKLADSQDVLLSPFDAISAWRRGIIQEDELNNILKKQFYNEESRENLKSVSEYFPNVGDLIRFAVREVYTPTIAGKYGLFEDLPPDFLREGAKAGLTEEQAKNFWGAHWELPSATQGYEMLHRQIIDDAGMSELLKSLDVMPYWRDKLMQMSYSPYTRVDVRRMYEMGVLSEEELVKSYKDIGYDDVHAEKLTEFTKAYTSNESTGITRSSVISGYKKQLLSEPEASGQLSKLGYTDETVDFWLNMADYEQMEKDIEDYIKELQSQFRLGVLSIEDFRNIVQSLDLPATYTNKIINTEILSLSKKIKTASKGDIDNWLEHEIINEKEYSLRLTNLGYLTEDIVNYLTYANLTKSTEKRKFLSVQIYQRWLTTDIIDAKRFTSIMAEMGIKDEDIKTFIEEIESIKQAEKEGGE